MPGPSLRHALLLTVLGLPRALAATDSSDLAWYALGMEQGLAGSTVNCILQDRKGLLWFGGEGGLSRFDGHSFSVFRPGAGPSALGIPAVTALVEDRDGALLVATEGAGLFRFDPSLGSFRPCAVAGRVGGSDRILALARDREGRSYAGSALGRVYRSGDGQNFSALGSPAGLGAAVTGLKVDGKGRLWVATDGQGLYLYDDTGSALAHWRHIPGDPSSLAGDRLSALFEDSLGGLWIGFPSGGVDLRVEGGFRHASVPEVPGGGRLTCLAEDTEGRIWVGYEGSGIAVLDSSSLVLAPASAADRLRVRALLRDSRGLMWAGLGEGGIRSYNPASSLVRSWTLSAGDPPPGGPRGLVELGPSHVVLAREGGLEIFDPAKRRSSRLLLPPEAGAPTIRGILAGRDGSLWIGTEASGLFALRSDGSLLAFAHRGADARSLGEGPILPLLEEADGTLWFGVEGGGLDRLGPARRGFEHFQPDPTAGMPAPGLRVTCLLRDAKGGLWAGSADAGLAYLEPGSSAFALLPSLGGRGGSISGLLDDGAGGLWIGTLGAGLWRLAPESDLPEPFADPEGILGASIHALVRSRDGLLWFATDRGLVSLDPRVGSLFLFGREDGLPAGLPEGAALLPARDGRLWVAAEGGICDFDPAAMPRYATQPDVVVTGVESTGGSALGRSADGSAVVLAHDNGGLAFRIAVTDYVAPFRNRYAFRLEGLQEGWTSMGGDNAGHLASLPPGNYMLRVRGSNGNGVWNDYGASLAVKVRQPLWGTWWFRSGLALLLLALAGLALAIRVRSLRERNRLLAAFARHVEEAREEERKTAARDVHDYIGQDLMVLNLHAFWLSTHAEARLEERQARLGQVQAAVLDAMASVKAVATRLRPEALDALDFPDAVRWHLASLRRAGGLEIEEDIDDAARGLDSERASALYRVLQEMLSNVLRHARASRARVVLALRGKEVVLEVEDDGVGMTRDSAEAPDSFGLIGMRERCSGLGGSLAIEGREGGGTRVVARLPQRGSGPGPGGGARFRGPPRRGDTSPEGRF